MTQVRDFWKPQNGHQDFRTWTDKEWWERMEPTAEIDKPLEALDKRRIRTHTGEDKLRWGYRTTRYFTIKEAYNILINVAEPPT